MREDGLAIPPEWLDKLADAVADKLAERSQPPAEQWPQWMNAETASRYLDCSTERLHKLKQRGQIPYAQDGPGGRLAFCRSDLDAWMAAKTAPEVISGSRKNPPSPTGSVDVVG
jgi:hypothetical protein